MLRYCLKTPPLKKIDRICFFLLKTKKNNGSSASDLWDNTKYSFKENDGAFSINSTSKENLQDELYQLENKQAKGAKLGANIR